MLWFRDKNKNKGEPEFESKKIRDDLAEIYENDSGGDIDMEHLDKRPGGRVKAFFTTFFSCAFLVFFVFTIGWIIFNRPSIDDNHIENKSLVLSIDCPDSISSGEKITYKIKYENRDKVDMTKVQLLLSYPEGFIFESSTVDAENINKTVFNIKDVEPMRDGEIEVIGRLVGDEGDVKNLLASISYEPANFSSEFQELATSAIKITSAIVEVGMAGSEQIIQGKEIKYNVSVKNNSDSDINDLRLIVEYPEFFLLNDVDPLSNDGIEIVGLRFEHEYSVWEIPMVGGGEEIEFVVSGSFMEDVGMEQEFRMMVEVVDGDDSYSAIAGKSFVVRSLSKEIDLNLIINGSGDDRVVGFGDELSYSIAYENSGKEDLRDVVVSVYLTGFYGDKSVSLVDWDTLRDEHVGDVSGDKILWTSEEILKLSSFSSGEEGVIDFFVNLKDDIDGVSGSGDLLVRSVAEMVVGRIDDTDVDIVVRSNEIDASIGNDMSFSSGVRYFNDDNIAVGFGPVPPKVGETTKYRVFWKINNSLHDIRNVVVSSRLPDGVEWSERVNSSGGSVDYNSVSREVVWSIDSFLASTGIATMDFEISITPTEDDLNRILTLLNSCSVSAIDSVTGENIYDNTGPLTTDLHGDPVVSGRGLVE